MLPSTNTTPTMTSTQLSELLGIEKKEVNRKIKDMFSVEIHGGEIPPSLDNRGYVVDYMLNELYSTMFVAKWHLPFLRKISQYWIERKSSQLKLPQSKREWIEFALEQEKQLELAAPKIEFHDTVVQSKNTYKYQEAGKKIQQRPNKFIAWLREEKYIDKHNMPYQRYIDQGLFKTSSGVDKGGFSFTQGRVTEKGLSYFSNKLSGKIL